MNEQMDNFKEITQNLEKLKTEKLSLFEKEKLENLLDETYKREVEFNDLMTKYKQVCDQKITCLDSLRNSTFAKDSELDLNQKSQMEHKLVGNILEQFEDVDEREKNIEQIKETVETINKNSKKIKEVTFKLFLFNFVLINQVIEYQGDRLSGIIKIQNKIDHNAENANKELEEADKLESRNFKRVCAFTSILIFLALVMIGIFYVKVNQK